MACIVCQFLQNILLLLDHALNTLLLGDPNETVSRRVGRARDAGSKAAAVVCRALSVVFRDKDHCSFAEEPGTTANEIWHWSPNFTEPKL